MSRISQIRIILFAFVIAFSIEAFAARHADLPNSQNGSDTPDACPADGGTPFLAALNGTVAPSAGSNSTNNRCSDPTPLPNGNYPDLSLSLSSAPLGVTVTLVPSLFGGGGFGNPKTILSIALAAPANWTLKSIILGSLQLNPAYIICDPGGAASSKAKFVSGDVSFCTDQPLAVVPPLATPQDNYSIHSVFAAEPEPIPAADTNTTRWDFVNFAVGQTLAITVDNFMYDSGGTIEVFFQNQNTQFGTGTIPANNNLSLNNNNVLAVVTDENGVDHSIGGLSLLQAGQNASNDLFTEAKTINPVAFTDVLDLVNTTLANPTLTSSGLITGLQSDPAPSCFSGTNFGTPQSPDPDPSQVFRSVWYAYTANGAGLLSLSTLGSRYDTRLSVFTGSSTPTSIACIDDTSETRNGGTSTVPQAQSTFPITAGTNYFIMVSEEPPPFGSSLTNTASTCTPEQNFNCQPYVPATLNGSLENKTLPLSRDATLTFSASLTGLLTSLIQMNFPDQLVNTISAPAQVTFTAVNDSISGLELSGTGDFQIISGTCTATLTEGDSCTVGVTFNPSSTGVRNGTIIASGTAVLANTPVSAIVTLSGNGATLGDPTAFVRQQYLDFLDRQADSAGLSGWVSAIYSGLTQAQLIANFMSSSEFANKGRFVAQAYVGILARDADYSGFRGWLSSLESGGAQVGLVNAFIGSAEFQANFGNNLNNTQFVTRMYENVLLRQPDQGGLNFWVAQLNNGLSRGQVALEFLQSSEFQGSAASQNRATVSLLYFDMLRRQPDAGGFQAFLNALNSGTMITDVISAFLNSTEYKNRF